VGSEINLQSIIVTPLSILDSAGGQVLHGIKTTDAGYAGFGEAYFSSIDSGATKGWKKHTKMVMNLLVPVGRVRFVFFENEYAAYRVEEIGVDNYSRITVPPGIWFAFKGLSDSKSIILNVSSIIHDDSESDRKELSEIYYDWK